MEIAGSAKKHQITVEDMLHAFAYAIYMVQQTEDRTFFIGPDTAGNLLEIVVLDYYTDEPWIIHAMRLRKNYYHFIK